MITKINQYDVLQTGKYKGNHQVIVGYLDKEENFKPKFCAVKNKQGDMITIPLAIMFGSDAETILFLEAWIDEIKKPKSTEDVPF